MIPKKFKMDYASYYPDNRIKLTTVLRRPALKFLLFLRLSERSKLFYIIQRIYGRKFGLELESHNIGGGLNLGHPFNITVNPSAKLGEWVSLTKGVTIGIEKGACPTINDGVRLGANATVTGPVTIGKYAKIAPNTFVNFEVPDKSVVTMSKAKIHIKKD